MAQVNNSYWMPSYLDDFGHTSLNVPLKFSGAVSTTLLESLGYTTRTSSVFCEQKSKRGKMVKRHIIATFGSGNTQNTLLAGSKIIFPVNKADILSASTVLIAAGAVCLELVGEKHRLVTSADIGTQTYSTLGSYADIPKKGTKARITYSYSPDVLTNPLTFTTNIETNQQDLYNAQKSCLANAVESTASLNICSGASLGINPRRYKILHLVAKSSGQQPDGHVSRDAIVSASAPSDIINCASTVARAGKCLAYEGESVKHLELVLGESALVK